MLHLPDAPKGAVSGSLTTNQATARIASGIVPTAMVPVEDDSSKITMCRAMIDTGSQISLISESAVQRMNLKRHKQTLTINGIGNVSKTYRSGSVSLRLKPSSGHSVITVNAYVLPSLTQVLPEREFSIAKCFHLRSVDLADPEFNKPRKVEMILGSDVAEQIFLDGKFQEDNGLHFRNTIFGWTASGVTRDHQSNVVTTSLCITNSFNLKQFWELEEVPEAKRYSDEEIACEKHFKETTYIEDNRFHVGMPFKPDSSPLGDTFTQAKRRFLNLEKRLDSNPNLKKGYTEFIHEFIDLNHLEPVPDNEIAKPDHQLNFLPHHCVHKEDSTTTKLRVVFDGSAKSSNGNSFNGSLMVGPTVQQDLFSILIRFRLHKVALSGDIAKMYRQIALDPAAKDFHRLLWRDSNTDFIKQFRMTRVTYGIASSAFHSTRSVVEVANLCKDQVLAQSIKNDFYVDDYLSGAESTEDAKTKVDEICAVLNNYGFELRKWASSHHEITLSLPENLRESTNQEKFMDNNYKIKTLGVSWKPNSDHFGFYSNLTIQGNVTKRQLLSETAKLFDPVGWLSPIVIRFKVLLQKLWVQGIEWDQLVSKEIQNEWEQIKDDLPNLAELKLQRCISPQGKIANVQLHLFTDASEMAYAVVIYARITDIDGHIVSKLVASKTRVAPIKTVSLPRLELCAAHLGIKLLVKIKEIFALTNLPSPTIYGWTDSTIVLQWLSQLPRTWTCFVANRVSEIQQTLPRENWYHVKSNLNPADCASRGMMVQDLLKHDLWWFGPNWLLHPEDTWPQLSSKIDDEMRKIVQTEQKHKFNTTTVTASQVTEPLFDIKRYSTLSKVFRVAANVHLAIDLLQRVNNHLSLTPSRLAKAKCLIISLHQQEFFTEDFFRLKAGQEVSRKSKLLNLCPFYDGDTGTIRVGGRLSQSSLAEYQKFPHLIHPDSHLAVLILRHFHEATLHGGGQLTLNSSRSEYWIVRGKTLANKFIRKCVKCSRFSSEIPAQLMADLPSERVTPTKPFVNVGIDLAGPIIIKPDNKTWIAVFVCFSTKAVHIELVTDLTKDSCIAALKRFVARRGLPEKIFSDNGTNFIGARNDIAKVQSLFSKDTNENSIKNYINSRGIEWITIPPRAPHFGGLWEAAIKSMKRHLRRCVGTQILTHDELNTFVIQIEGILNSRPLTPMSADPNDLQPLTPAHFILGRGMNDLLSLTASESDENLHLNVRLKLLEKLKSSFWKSWHRDYLATLQIRKRWLTSGPEFAKGDLVLIAEDNQPPLHWKMARVIDLYSGNDEINRVAKVRTTSGTLMRAIVKLRKLPIDPPQAISGPDLGGNATALT